MWQGMQASKSFRSWDHRKILEVFTVFEPNQLADFHKIMSLLSPVLVFKYTTQLLQLSNMGNCYSCCRAKWMDEFINWSLKSGAASWQKRMATSCVRTVRHFIVVIWYMRHATTTKAVTASPWKRSPLTPRYLGVLHFFCKDFYDLILWNGRSKIWSVQMKQVVVIAINQNDLGKCNVLKKQTHYRTTMHYLST